MYFLNCMLLLNELFNYGFCIVLMEWKIVLRLLVKLLFMLKFVVELNKLL